MKTIAVTAPSLLLSNQVCSVFLAGSIEMGNADEWQSRVINDIAKRFPQDVVLYNPRRPDWDSSWEQNINNAQFFEQVTWEQDHIDAADIVFMYFDPSTQSPISLLELGMFASSGKMIVCCPNGFYRKGNVDVVCQKFNIPLFTDFEASLVALRNKIREYTN
jgi:hypothetical protein